MAQDQSASRNWRELKETFDAIADGPHFNFVAVPKEDWRTISAALSERGPSAEAARIARKVLDEKGLYNITTEEMVLAREILRLASPAERTKP